MTARMARLMERSEEFKAMWLDVHAGKGYIAQRLRCTPKEVDALRKELGLPEKISPSHLPNWEPTEEEIAERRAEFQAKWSADNRSSHETADVAPISCLKEFSFCRRTMSFR